MNKILDNSGSEDREKFIARKVLRRASTGLKDELDAKGEGEEVLRITSTFLPQTD